MANCTACKEWVNGIARPAKPHRAAHRLTMRGHDIFYCCAIFNHSYADQRYQHVLVGKCKKWPYDTPRTQVGGQR